MDKNLTDNDIVKALEVLDSWQQIALQNDDGTDIESPKLYEAIEVVREQINRQKAEIENLRNSKYIFTSVDYCESDLTEALKENDRLKAEIERIKAKVNHFQYLHEIFTTTPTNRIKSEAYKEFAERLKQSYEDYSDHSSLTVKMFCFDIDNLLKELVGDEK